MKKNLIKQISLIFSIFILSISFIFLFGYKQSHNILKTNQEIITSAKNSKISKNNPHKNKQNQGENNYLTVSNSSKKNARNSYLYQTTKGQSQFSKNQDNKINETNKSVEKPSPNIELVEQVFLEVTNLGNFNIDLKDNNTVFKVLLKAGEIYNFPIAYDNYGELGVFIKCINNICNNGNNFWFYYYNGRFANIGASLQEVKNNDKIEWKYE